ncbi:DUF4393 domain-containing protein [Acinetobacter haemolyticus]|uniref:DUF4393 domain-containing protein n=1 Tax=Acinetobacter haemolyticus TaxID=29430 RepID=UPI003D1F2458
MPIIDTKGIEPFADLMKEIYGDLAKPGVTQIGIALATVIGLLNTCLSPIKFLNTKTELNRQKNLDKLAERFSEIPQEEILEAPPEIAVPIAEKLVYVSNEELRDMYIELLAKASTKSLNENAHPSFVNIINNLCPDEALIIKILFSKADIPFIEVNLIDINDDTFININPYLTEFEMDSNLIFKNNSASYLSNLTGLGIIHIRHEYVVIDENTYESLEKYTSKLYEDYLSELDEMESQTYADKELELKRSKFDITPFGQLFINAVSHQMIDITEDHPQT